MIEFFFLAEPYLRSDLYLCFRDTFNFYIKAHVIWLSVLAIYYVVNIIWILIMLFLKPFCLFILALTFQSQSHEPPAFLSQNTIEKKTVITSNHISTSKNTSIMYEKNCKSIV